MRGARAVAASALVVAAAAVASTAGDERDGVARAGAEPGCAPIPPAEKAWAASDPSFATAPIPLCRAGSIRGAHDPHELDLGALIPRGRVRQVWFVRGRRGTDQVLVEWIDEPLPRPGHQDELRVADWGLTLWHRTGRGSGMATVWAGASVPVLRAAPRPASLDVRFGDVTSDGRPDLLIAQYPGTNHGCGPHQAIAVLPGRGAWRVFGGAPLCETEMSAADGLLEVVRPIYRRGDAMCCPRLRETTYRRWTGERFRIVGRRRTSRWPGGPSSSSRPEPAHPARRVAPYP